MEVTLRFTTSTEAMIAMKGEDYLAAIQEFRDWLGSSEGLTGTYDIMWRKFNQITDLYRIERT